ncbi:MAG: lysine 2,3-aminomutase [Planctomycetota bacterium]|nr:MAG: lysine 2,3-aminomutase [Planctomycetota bacterium]
MIWDTSVLPSPRQYRPITRASVKKLPQWGILDAEVQEAIEVVSTVLPFKTNQYVVDELIDWSQVPHDPIFQLTFPQRGMLSDSDYRLIQRLIRADADRETIQATARKIQERLNPHPAGQMTHNVPHLDGRPLQGLQHKYNETVLVFPTAGQTCHAYCTFCFRWAQFVGDADLRFATKEADDLVAYLRRHKEVTDVLITGGDPMVMKTRVLARYIEPLLSEPGLEHIQDIRIGTKSVAYWPQRYVHEDDADDLLRLFERVAEAGKHLAIMGHYNHPMELRTPMAQAAVRRIRSTGANIRMQSPLVRHINDDAQAWNELWKEGTRLGCIPYYMFVERDTGPKHYFEVPLARAWEIFREAFQTLPGLARTVRGPSMSAFPGKVLIDGVAEIHGEQVFCLQFLQARNPDWVRRPFFARFDPDAVWLDDLEPAFDDEFFFCDQGVGSPEH